jgi:hypothetical protein
MKLKPKVGRDTYSALTSLGDFNVAEDINAFQKPKKITEARIHAPKPRPGWIGSSQWLRGLELPHETV